MIIAITGGSGFIGKLLADCYIQQGDQVRLLSRKSLLKKRGVQYFLGDLSNENVDLKSFVFPKNEVNYEYLEVLKKYSFKAYRDSSPAKFKRIFFDRIFRLMNTFLKLSKYSVNTVEEHQGLKAIKGDRFLRPHTFSFLNYLMLKRIKNEMTFAALNNSIYHLWWHPHNFGKNLDKNLDNLEIILKEYATLQKKFNMKSVCMKDL